MSLSRRSKPATERIFCRLMPRSAACFQGRDDVVVREHGLDRRLIALHQAEGRLQVGGENPIGVGAIARVARNFSGIRIVPRSSSLKCAGSSSQALNSRPSSASANDPLAIDLVFERRFLERPRSARCSQTLSGDSRCENPGSAISARARSEDWSRCGRCSRVRPDPAGHPSRSVFPQAPHRSAAKSPAASHRRAISAQVSAALPPPSTA